MDALDAGQHGVVGGDLLCGERSAGCSPSSLAASLARTHIFGIRECSPLASPFGRLVDEQVSGLLLSRVSCLAGRSRCGRSCGSDGRSRRWMDFGSGGEWYFLLLCGLLVLSSLARIRLRLYVVGVLGMRHACGRGDLMVAARVPT
ncbi:hypothetical protein GOP47_0028710 [Adiantum capillus-veneris]|nr:hypothetical protein GOP47_0028710 [Adiantum capillus-veneris]